METSDRRLNMTDYMVRATAGNAQIRAFAVTTRNIVETARQAHNTSPVVTAGLGRLLTAGVMMGSMLKGEKDLLTLQIKGDGPVRGLTVTANAQGEVKGYADVPDVILPANAKGKLDVGGAVGRGTLNVIKDMGCRADRAGDRRDWGRPYQLFCIVRADTVFCGTGRFDGKK